MNSRRQKIEKLNVSCHRQLDIFIAFNAVRSHNETFVSVFI